MGGEKLKLPRPHWGISFAIIFILINFAAIPVFTQAPPEIQSVDESTIILGEAPVDPVSNGSSSIFVVLRMVLVLALAALAIYGVFFIIKRLARPQESRDPHLKILARAPLSNDSFAAVVSVGPKAWLVAGGSGSVNLISEIADTESLETMLLDEARRSAEAGTRRYFDFRSLIRRFSQGEAGGASGINSLTGNLKKQRDRLKRL